MNGFLRGLIVATCLAVLAAIGFWSWKLLRDEAQANEMARDRAAQIECRQLLEDILQSKGGHNLLEVAICMEKGNLTKEQFVTAGRGDIADQIDAYERKKKGQ